MSHLARISERAEQTSAPLSALFELTGRCNLDCSHCYLDIAHPPEELTTAEACAIVDQLADAGTLFLTLSGGELFLRPDALEIGRHARARGMALRLFTNATRIDAKLAREIALLRPLGVEVSIYGSHAAVHDAVTQRRRTLRRTLRGLVHMKRAGVPFALKAPLLQPVAGEIDRLHDLAARLDVPIKFDPFIKPRNDGNAAPLPLRAADDALAAAFANPKADLLPTRELPGPLDGDEIPCALARRTVKIDPKGDVFPCPSWPESIGNLRRARFVDLWRSGPLLDRLRAMRVRDAHGACTDCNQSGYCHRCAAVALLEHGDELGPADEACRLADAQERALGLPSRSRRAGRVRLRVIG
jgi:radical SAM protein with 4Fe4S-binding SPASM domain